MLKELELIDLGFVQLSKIDHCIIKSFYKAETSLDSEKCQIVNQEIGKLTKGKAFLQLFIACPHMEVTKDAREYGTTEEANKYTLASAIVCNSLAHKILGNFFIRTQNPPRPTKMFNNEQKAIEWLKSHLN